MFNKYKFSSRSIKAIVTSISFDPYVVYTLGHGKFRVKLEQAYYDDSLQLGRIVGNQAYLEQLGAIVNSGAIVKPDNSVLELYGYRNFEATLTLNSKGEVETIQYLSHVNIPQKLSYINNSIVNGQALIIGKIEDITFNPSLANGEGTWEVTFKNNSFTLKPEFFQYGKKVPFRVTTTAYTGFASKYQKEADSVKVSNQLEFVEAEDYYMGIAVLDSGLYIDSVFNLSKQELMEFLNFPHPNQLTSILKNLFNYKR